MPEITDIEWNHWETPPPPQRDTIHEDVSPRTLCTITIIVISRQVNQSDVLCMCRSSACAWTYSNFFCKDNSWNRLPDAAMPLVKWALGPKGSSNNFKSYVLAITSTNQWENPTHKRISVIKILLRAIIVTGVSLKAMLPQYHWAAVLLCTWDMAMDTVLGAEVDVWNPTHKDL